MSSQKYKIKEFKRIATQWVITGEADVSKLSAGITEFCRGMKIYEVEEHDKDGVNAVKGMLYTVGAKSMNKSCEQTGNSSRTYILNGHTRGFASDRLIQVTFYVNCI